MTSEIAETLQKQAEHILWLITHACEEDQLRGVEIVQPVVEAVAHETTETPE